MTKETFSDQISTLWPAPRSLRTGGEIERPTQIGVNLEDIPEWFANDLDQCGISIDETASTVLFRKQAEKPLSSQGYEIELHENGIGIAYEDAAGMTHALVTLSQIFALFAKSPRMPALSIEDEPHYRNRAFMVDLGRSVWTLSALKRVVRMLFRMKMNLLHLHLFDDEMCGVKFKSHPFGSENPHALELEEIRELADFASAYGIEIMVEVETWGHVGALVYHYPELKGGPGMFGGASFLICQKTFDILRDILEEILDALPSLKMVHLGLDEAHWFLGSDMRQDFTPSDLIACYENMMKEIAESRGREILVFAYADHHGRPLSEGSKIILQPWNYWIHNQDMIESSVSRYSSQAGREWFPMAGQSMAQHRGAFQATRHWCQCAASASNVWGVDIAFWGRNDLGDRFLTLFAGAQYAWSPNPVAEVANIPDPEVFDARVHPIMHFHQAFWNELSPQGWQDEKLPFVYRGRHMWGPHHGAPVTPTVSAAGIDAGQAFYAEGSEKENDEPGPYRQIDAIREHEEPGIENGTIVEDLLPQARPDQARGLLPLAAAMQE